MSSLLFPWSIYRENQSKAARCNRITNRFWGIENGLNNFLTAVASSSDITDPQEFQNSIDRAIATGARVERNRTQLRLKYLRQDPECHAERHMLARARFAEIRGAVNAAEWALLVALAAGIPSYEIAASRGITVGCLRTRLSRLRARLGRHSKNPLSPRPG